ncbi:HET-domain-containing protein, partial [Alternaria alternata]
SYVTLSHCWGQTLQARLTTDLVDDYTLGIPWKHLTPTFQDAIVTSLKLGMYYIWIDALCIIQDDEEDWSREAVRMTGVYLNSYLNIFADASRDGAGGLFRRRNPIACQSFIVPHWKGHSQRCASIFYTDRWFRDIQSSPLSKRAWTVQEMFLAPRALHFATEVVHWECMELCTTESLPTLLNIIPESNIIIRKSALRYDLPEQDRAQVLYDAWYRLVIAYSGGTLTFTSDRIIAIAGLAGIFCRLLGLSEGDYLCGIWRPQLEHDLMWK